MIRILITLIGAIFIWFGVQDLFMVYNSRYSYGEIDAEGIDLIVAGILVVIISVVETKERLIKRVYNINFGGIALGIPAFIYLLLYFIFPLPPRGPQGPIAMFLMIPAVYIFGGTLGFIFLPVNTIEKVRGFLNR